MPVVSGKRPGSLNLAQRAVLVVSLAALLWLVAIYAITKGFSGPRGGWFAYAPNTGVVFGDENRLSSAASWFVWLGALTIWTMGSLWLLRPSRSTDHDESTAPDSA